MGVYTRFAPVCPIQIYEAMQADDSLGDYHLPLAHDVLHYPGRYENIFKPSLDGAIPKGKFSVRYRNQDWTVILDNSVIELGYAVDIKVVADAARIVHANVIVLPDILLDTDATIDSCLSAIEPWTKELNKVLTPGTWSFMVVPQGKTIGDFARCAEAFANCKNVHWWGIPRNFNIHGLGSRRDAIEICWAINNLNRIHLLGFSDNIVDDILSARSKRVTGIDSAVPLRAASLGHSFGMGLSHNLPPRGDWWNNPDTKYNKLMRENVRTVRAYVKS
jgi:hypothetical protein